MAPGQRSLDAGDVLAFLDQRFEEHARASSVSNERQAYRDAAAVLVAIAEPRRLHPAGLVPPGDVESLLGPDLIPATGHKFAGVVMLAPDVRVATLRELAASGRIEQALAANPHERTGNLQEQFERYLTGTAAPLGEQTLAQLDETHQVAVWCDDAIEGVPSEQEVADRAAYLRLLAPFEAIAGDETFRGRRKELDDLRSYIGVLPPESLLKRLRSAAFKWWEPESRPALSLSGPGGVGKSALVARFMLEHTRVREEARIPFAYLDFDRASLDVGEPLGLCIEMIRQLKTQFPEARSFDELLATASDASGSSHSDSETEARWLLSTMLRRMTEVLGPRLYVVVLDTFEEVQYRGESRALPLWNMLAELQLEAPFLRVVVSGRAPAKTLRLADRAPLEIELGDLDRQAAIAFLVSQGVDDRSFAEQLVGTFGGVPLSLKLVASLVSKKEHDVGSMGRSRWRGGLFVSLSTEVVQGQLYERILEHIRTEQVRKLAHPGLVLRRISPEIIFSVLNRPCELALASFAEAQALFSELQRETSLVAVDDLDGSLVHRADLRRVMLRHLVESQPDRVTNIRRAAVEWYAHQKGRRAKAEELYHRLHLGERVDERELYDREVRASIQSSVVEFSASIQLWLSTLGLQIPEKTRQLGTLEQQDASSAALVEEYLSYGTSSEVEAARIIDEGTRDLDRASPLFRSAARLAAQQGATKRAEEWIDRGLEHSVEAGATLLTLGLLQEKAWLRREAPAAVQEETLGQLREYALRHQHREALLQHALQTVGLSHIDHESAMKALEGLLAATAPEQVWGLTLALEPAVALTQQGRSSLLEVICMLLLTEDSPFRYAELADRRAQLMLRELLSAAEKPDLRFAKVFQELCQAWPYRILFVSARYGRSGDVLAESAFA